MPPRKKIEETQEELREREEAEELDAQKHMYGVEEALAAGEGTVPVAQPVEAGTRYIWPSPGSLVVEEEPEKASGIGGDVGVGTVRVADQGDEWWLGVPILYTLKRAPRMTHAGKDYAVVKVEDVIGVTSRDKEFLGNHIASKRGPERPEFRPDELDEVDVLRHSSQISSPSGGNTSGSASPFSEFGG